MSRLVAGIDSSTQSCKVVRRATPTPARWSATGRAAPPRRHRGRPGRVVAGAGGGGRRGRRARRRRRGRRRRPAARHGLPRRARATSSGPRCCGTTPARPRPPPTWSPSSAERPGLGGRGRLGARWRRSRSPSSAGSPSTSRSTRRAHRGGLPAPRLAHLAARGRRDLADLVTDRSDASGTGYWSPRDRRLPHRPARTGARAASPAVPGCSARAETGGHAPLDGRASSAPAPATTRPPRSGSARAPGDVVALARHARASSPPWRQTGCADADRHRRPASPTRPAGSCRSSARSTPPASSTPPPGCSASTTTGSPTCAPRGGPGRRRPGRWSPTSRASGRPNLPDATGPVHGLTLRNVDARRTSPGPPSRGCCAGSPTGWTRCVATGVEPRRRAAGRRRRRLRGGAPDRARPSSACRWSCPHPGEYVADGAARQAAWVAAARTEPPTVGAGRRRQLRRARPARGPRALRRGVPDGGRAPLNQSTL